jgi:hypothetical protein
MRAYAPDQAFWDKAFKIPDVELSSWCNKRPDNRSRPELKSHPGFTN